MTDADKQMLSEKIAALAEAQGIDPALLWTMADQCPQGHKLSRIISEGTHTDLCWDCVVGSSVKAVELKAHILDPSWHSEWRISRQTRDMTDPAVLLPVVEAWQEVQRMLIVRLDFERTDQWRGYLHICIPLPEGRESLVEDHDYPGYGQSWGEAAAQALCAALEIEKRD